MLNLTPLEVLSISVIISVAWFVSMLTIRRNMQSLFRYKLWPLRDAIVDDLLSGELPDMAVTRDLLDTVESTIRYAELITIIEFLIMPSPTDSYISHRKELMSEIERMTKAQRGRYEWRSSELRKIILRRLMFGSVGGWLVVVAGLAFGLLAALIRHASSPFVEAKKTLARNVASEQKIFMFKDGVTPKRRINHDPLSMCVN